MATGNVPHSIPNRAVQVDQIEQVYRLKLLGHTHAQIAVQLGISKTTVHNRLKDAYAARIYPAVDEYRKLHLDRLEGLLVPLAVPVSQGHLGSINAAMGVYDRISRLLGLDSPVKVDHTVTETTQEDIELAALIREAKARNAAEEIALKEKP